MVDTVNDLPCLKCPVLAMCIHRKIIKCPLLLHFLNRYINNFDNLLWIEMINFVNKTLKGPWAMTGCKEDGITTWSHLTKVFNRKKYDLYR